MNLATLRLSASVVVLCLLLHGPATAENPPLRPGPPLPGTERLTMEGDIASEMVAGIDRFLLRKMAQSIEARDEHWNRDLTSPEAYRKSVEGNRRRLAEILGVRDERVATRFQFQSQEAERWVLGEGAGYKVYAVRWPVFGSIEGEGLLLVPEGKPIGGVIAIPDAGQSPEQLVGLAEGIAAESQFARRLAESGCEVLVPTIVPRDRGLLKLPGGFHSQLPGREFLYRSAFVLGRHLIGYEVQKVLGAVDCFAERGEFPIGVIGYGEGGLLSLYAGALDPRLEAVAVSGYFDARENLWREPIDRNVFGLLKQFGDAELATLIAPNRLIVETAVGPAAELSGEHGAAPARLASPELANVTAEVAQAAKLTEGLVPHDWIHLVKPEENAGAFGSDGALKKLITALDGKASLAGSGSPPIASGKQVDHAARVVRQMEQIELQNQRVLRESPYTRKQFFKPDTSSLAAYEKSVEPYREIFAQQVIGQFDDERLPLNPRTRQVYQEEKWTGYEVVLDVFPEVIAYGLLLVPNDIGPNEKRPVVVCQHGLEGRPQDVIGEQKHAAYQAYAAKLAERGFITFAPQNPYIFKDRFRTLQRKANPLGKTLFSVIVPQHQQIVDWLKTQGNVDPKRIGFYGLSYGGKSAMRIPPLVPDYCLSICSADFNEWVDKNASTRNPRSYVWTGEYEIFEFDLGSTFNYAEMAALIAPRPFMVERGHFDGVADDETVGYEFAKVRHLYAARLKIPERCEIEWFDGPHAINGEGTFDFLHRHLDWPRPDGE